MLQGVSQQQTAERLPGQVTAQVNMISDPVTGLRRRPGALVRGHWAWEEVDEFNVTSWSTDVGGVEAQLVLNAVTGNLRVFEPNNLGNPVQMANLTDPYLIGTAQRMRGAAVGDEFFIANLGMQPIRVYANTDPDPSKRGFAYVVAGSFGRQYRVTVNVGSTPYTFMYQTPDGTAAGHAALSTPEYIAQSIRTGLAAAMPFAAVDSTGPYIFINASSQPDPITVQVNTGKAYMIGSKGSFVDNAGELPAELPLGAHNYIVRVGSAGSAQFYRYDYYTSEWREYSAWGSLSNITQCPIALRRSSVGAWSLVAGDFEGRFAGDDDSNPEHEWMARGITGLSTYQGRLVILSNSRVSMSSAKNPRRFLRSSVTSVLAGDGIEVGSSMLSSAAYEYAVQFQKDLLLFTRSYQALVPNNNQAISPTTAMVVPTSAHTADMTCCPVVIGRTLMYPNIRSGAFLNSFFGMLEMVPSNSVDSQYVSQDATAHLPKYLPGRCRFAISSGVASMALFGPSGDPRSLIVHEYHWDGDNKVQQAWHQWTFEYPIATAYFSKDLIMIVFVQNGYTVICSIDPRASAVQSSGVRTPHYDFLVATSYGDNQIPVAAWRNVMDPDIGDKIKATEYNGPLAGEAIGTTYVGTGTPHLQSDASHPIGSAWLGLPYYSGLIPSPPVITDYQQNVIHTGKATLLRFLVGLKNTSPYKVTVTDKNSIGEEEEYSTLTFDSDDLQLGQGLYSDEFLSIIPCRTDMRSTALELYTEGPGELNISHLEYVGKYHSKIKRK